MLLHNNLLLSICCYRCSFPPTNVLWPDENARGPAEERGHVSVKKKKAWEGKASLKMRGKKNTVPDVLPFFQTSNPNLRVESCQRNME